jgi:hypothetical protein
VNIDKTLNKIEKAQFPIIVVPFHGDPVEVMVRKLTQAQTLACGSISLIETFHDKVMKKSMAEKVRLGDICSYAERNTEILKKALVKPTYDQVLNMVADGKTIEIKKQLEETREKLNDLKPGPKKSALLAEIDALKIWCEFILPEDFMAAIVSFTLGIDESDIKELSESMLLEAARLATNGHDNPSDHIHGIFTDFMKDDINKRAWILLAEEREKNKNGR